MRKIEPIKGKEIGQTCNRPIGGGTYCQGVITIDCQCGIEHPPCGNCTDNKFYCPNTGQICPVFK